MPKKHQGSVRNGEKIDKSVTVINKDLQITTFNSSFIACNRNQSKIFTYFDLCFMRRSLSS